MTKEQMQGLYRDAANKREQLEILGDLNLCTPAEIAGILGVEYRPKSWRVEMTDETIQTIKDMANQGCSLSMMYKATGIRPATLQKKMQKLNIKVDKQKWKERIYSKKQSKSSTNLSSVKGLK